MNPVESAQSALMVITDAMSESRTFPVNLMGPINFSIGDRALDLVDAIAQNSPVVLVTSKSRRQQLQAAFDYGRDIGATRGPAPDAPAPVRYLHSVSSWR